MSTTNLSPSTGKTVHFSAPMLIGLALLLVVPWMGVGLLATNRAGAGGVITPPRNSVAPSTKSAASAPATTSPTLTSTSDPLAMPELFESRVGPWGKMECVPIVLEVPEEYIFLTGIENEVERWTFTGMNKDAALALLQSCGLTPEQLTQLSKAEWTQTAGKSVVAVNDDLIMSFSQATRASLYNTLALDAANATVIDPFWFRPGRVDFRLRGSDLSESSLALLKRLLYPSRDGQAVLFTDIRPALRAISDPAEQRKFFKAVSRKRSLMARLEITADSDVEALANYWGEDGRQKDLVPVLNSLKYNVEAGIESPSKINILPLLPGFARERLYNHAYANQGQSSAKEDCFWTAFNFFSQYPDNGFNDFDHLSKVLQRDYYKIGQPSKLGDVILIVDDSGEAVHAANYIADDIIFTKNGVNFTQPWILVTMSDLLETYKIRTKSISIAYFRRK